MCVISRVEHQLGPLLPDRLYSMAHLGSSLLSLLFNLLSLLHSVRLFPVWGPLLMSLLDIQNRPTKARRRCRTSQVNRTESISSQSACTTKSDWTTQCRFTHIQFHTSACIHTHLGQTVKGEERGEPLAYIMPALFSQTAGALRLCEMIWPPRHL